MDQLKFYENKIIFLDGWYIHIDGKGNNSIVSYECAKRMEVDYHRYQADMDCGRGGFPLDIAYTGRGFRLKDDVYEYDRPLVIDHLADGFEITKIGRVLRVPTSVRDIPINTIDKRAFMGLEDLHEVIVPETIKTINDEAFKDCSQLKLMTLPNHSMHIGKDVFSNTYLEQYENKEVLVIDNHLIKVKETFLGHFDVPDHILTIADYAFNQCVDLSSVRLPDKTKVIGNSAFRECKNLMSIVFPPSVDYIGQWCFFGCTKLEKVLLPEGISAINRSVFEDCTALRCLTIPSSVRSINHFALRNTGVCNDFLESDDNVLYIGKWLIDFKSDYKGDLMIKDGTVGSADQWSLDLRSNERKLKSVVFPDGFKFLGASTFENCCNLSDVNLPVTLETIRQSAFNRCSNIRCMVVPASVTHIDIWVWMGCIKLQSLTFKGRETMITSPCIDRTNNQSFITVYGHNNSTAKEYCRIYGEQIGLRFKPLKTSIWSLLKR